MMGNKVAVLPGSIIYIPKIVETLRQLDGVAKSGAVRDAIVAAMIVAKEPINETVLKTGGLKYQNDIYWARMHLVNAGLLEPTEVSGHGIWKLTAQGWTTPLDKQAVIAIYTKSEKKGDCKPISESRPAPSDDVKQRGLSGMNSWELQLKKILTTMPDKGFERLCAAIMTKNGLHATIVTGQAGDQGIDGEGLLAIDKLLLVTVRVAWQCKRFSTGKVTPNEVRDFRGAMSTDTRHGVFFTTSFFTASAEAEAKHPGKTAIELVNLERLIGLLKDLELGVITTTTSVIDTKFFEQYLNPSQSHVNAYPLLK